MRNTAVDRAIKNDAETLVDQISGHWPHKFMTPVHADMQYGQYAEAVLNLIAINHKESLKLTLSEKHGILSLIHKMRLEEEVSELMRYLLGSPTSQQAYRDETVLALLQ